MINKALHHNNFISVLKEIYSDPEIRTALGFKGGTAAMLFYELPRFSVDLDFDLLDEGKKEIVFQKLKNILSKFGNVSDASEKKHTLLYILHYQKNERILKVEISKRTTRGSFEVKNYLGISMLVMKQPEMTAGKLSALITRKKFASRDMFDLWFFLKENWSIDEDIVREKTDFPLGEALDKAIAIVQAVTQNQLLEGLGELLQDEKQKTWVRTKLKDELIFCLRLYQDTHGK